MLSKEATSALLISLYGVFFTYILPDFLKPAYFFAGLFACYVLPRVFDLGVEDDAFELASSPVVRNVLTFLSLVYIAGITYVVLSGKNSSVNLSELWALQKNVVVVLFFGIVSVLMLHATFLYKKVTA